MGEKVIVGPVGGGLRTDREAFYIDNDSFPVLTNAYQWRGRAKRKRGTTPLTRLTRYFDSTNTSYSSVSSQALGVGGSGNVLTGFVTLESTSSIVLGSVIITDTTTGNVYTDNSLGILTGAPSGSGTINYATGGFVITGGSGNSIQAQFRYYPSLPSMGLEEYFIPPLQFPNTIGFDQTYAYFIINTAPYNSYSISFFKNPPVSASLPGYVQKTTVSPVKWDGQNYQQFFTTNYQGSFWATNGVTAPFTTTNIGMQFKSISNITISSGGPPAIVVITIGASHGLVVGDYVFLNEITGMTGINFQTGYVTAIAPTTITVELPNATVGGAYSSGGIVQYLTSQAASPTLDCIRWYDGDPTNGSATAPVLNGNLGWVNFCPPLSQAFYSIADLPPAQYYLVGARVILQFKDRLLFFGPVVQTSSASTQVYLQDTIIYSQNGTPYYTASFTGDPTLATTTFNPLLVPTKQTATPTAYWEDQTGFGGFISAGLDLPIVSVNPNQDVLIVGFFNSYQTKLVYTGNDLVPFYFYVINSEYGTSSTFSAVNMDQGVLTRGSRGFVITNQTGSQRFDLSIPDSVFQFNLPNNGIERVTSQRDFISEWVYFTYVANNSKGIFPNQTLFYNYRDNTWSIFNECYTTYGQFRRQTGFTWATIGTIYPTWLSWNVPWNSMESTLLNPEVIAGNQQGFVVCRDVGTTNEAPSLSIQNITSNTITCPNHCLSTGDYFTIQGVLGTIGSEVNGEVFRVGVVINTNSFNFNPTVPSGTYIGGGVITRMYRPFMQSKQFPVSWGISRKTRLGPQQYLLTTTDDSQVTLLIYLSQQGNDPSNVSPIVPSPGSINNSLIYSTILYTCPESANLGLTAPNTNLQMNSIINTDGTNASTTQAQIWHRMNTSLIGDTVQVAITLSDDQMFDPTQTFQFAEIELHGFILDTNPSSLLA